jgi:RNA polymerase sigma-70 factor (ECF subfamily)
MSTEHEQRLDAAFAAHYADIARYFRRRCPSIADADDATAEVFTVAWRQVAKLPPEPETRLWLFGVSRRVLADQRRARRRRERLDTKLTQRTASDVPDEGASTLEAMIVREAMHSLSDGDRELLGLAAWEGLSPNEIARVLGIPAAVVSARLYRARRRLEHRLKTIDSKETLACPTSSHA